MSQKSAKAKRREVTDWDMLEYLLDFVLGLQEIPEGYQEKMKSEMRREIKREILEQRG